MIMLHGLGLLPTATKTTTTTTTTTSSIPKSDYIKQLQCLINLAIVQPEMGRALQSTKEMWANALAWDAALPRGMPVTGYYRTSPWPTENDAIWLFWRGGIPEFATIDSALQPVDSNLLGFIGSFVRFLKRVGVNPAGCDFPAATAVRLAAAAAADAAAKAAADAAAKAAADAAAAAAAAKTTTTTTTTRTTATATGSGPSPVVTWAPTVAPGAKSPPGNQVTTVGPGVEPELAPAKRGKGLLLLGVLGVGAGITALVINRRHK